MGYKIIAATDQHCPQIVELIDNILIEYGDRICLEGVDGDLARVESAFWQSGGAFWVAIDESNKVIGTIAVSPKSGEKVELKKLYVDKNWRGKGIAQGLVEVFNNWCEENSYSKIVLWTDTRFIRAHFFYNKLGYTKGATRHMDDGNVPYSEFEYLKSLE